MEFIMTARCMKILTARIQAPDEATAYKLFCDNLRAQKWTTYDILHIEDAELAEPNCEIEEYTVEDPVDLVSEHSLDMEKEIQNEVSEVPIKKNKRGRSKRVLKKSR
jgi:hypothetical protein